MTRGTTPTLTFALPIDANTVTACNIALAQCGKVIISRDLGGVEIDGQQIKMTLTEEETLRLHANVELQIQIRVGVGESRMASQVFQVSVEKILQEGILSEI